jgi:hypothetical protein
MPKPLGSADLAGIYGDPERALAEGERDKARADADLASFWDAQVHGGADLGILVQTTYTRERNADFKIKRAKAAINLAAVGTTPVLAGFNPNQLKVAIVGGAVVALWLFFF